MKLTLSMRKVIDRHFAQIEAERDALVRDVHDALKYAAIEAGEHAEMLAAIAVAVMERKRLSIELCGGDPDLLDVAPELVIRGTQTVDGCEPNRDVITN